MKLPVIDRSDRSDRSPRSSSLRGAIVLLCAVLVSACASPSPSPTAPAPTAPVPTEAPARSDAPGTAPPTPNPTPEGPTTYVVSKQGDDHNAGTRDEPFRTVEHGITVAEPGDTVLVREGLYVENIDNPPIRPGTADERITLAAFPGERPVIQGLLWLTDADYWTIDGIGVTWNHDNSSHQHMVIMTDGVGWEIRNAEFWGAHSYAALLVAGTTPGEPDDWALADSCIHDTYWSNERNQDHNVYINTGLEAGEGVVEGNLIFNAENGSNIKVGGPESAPYDGSANVTIRRNTLYGASQPLLLAGGTNNITVERNIIANSVNPWLVRAFQLTGDDNVMRDNLGYQAEQWVFADSGFASLDEGGNLLPTEPGFDYVGCDGLEPSDSAAQEYGA